MSTIDQASITAMPSGYLSASTDDLWWVTIVLAVAAEHTELQVLRDAGTKRRTNKPINERWTSLN